MQDTIDLLESIGRDATLRHASPEELTKVLGQTQASDALTAAVASGDSRLLSDEFGHKPMYSTQVSQGTAHEEEEEDDKPGQDDDAPGDNPGPGTPPLSDR